jgi:hypothetical protein
VGNSLALKKCSTQPAELYKCCSAQLIMDKPVDGWTDMSCCVMHLAPRPTISFHALTLYFVNQLLLMKEGFPYICINSSCSVPRIKKLRWVVQPQGYWL